MGTLHNPCWNTWAGLPEVDPGLVTVQAHTGRMKQDPHRG